MGNSTPLAKTGPAVATGKRVRLPMPPGLRQALSPLPHDPLHVTAERVQLAVWECVPTPRIATDAEHPKAIWSDERLICRRLRRRLLIGHGGPTHHAT